MAERAARKQRGAAQPASSRKSDGALTGIPGYPPRGKGADFDRLVHERMRLGVLSALAVNKSLSFNDLKRLLKATDGNLSVHARKLEDAGYVSCTKSFDNRLPRTEYQLTAKGRNALTRYLDHMEALIHATRRT